MESNKEKKLRPTFYFMTEYHGFIKPIGENINEIIDSLKVLASLNPHGMVCPVRVYDGDEYDSFGSCVHVDSKGDVDLADWIGGVMKIDAIRLFGLQPMENSKKPTVI